MIKDVLLKALQQRKGRDVLFTTWSWIFANSNEHNIYYGTMKEICENCLIDYQKLNKAFELQYQWNKPEFEKTIVMRKDDAKFLPINNFHETDKYFNLFKIDLKNLPSPYRPLIVIFNSEPYETLQGKIDIRQSFLITKKEHEITHELVNSKEIQAAIRQTKPVKPSAKNKPIPTPPKTIRKKTLADTKPKVLVPALIPLNGNGHHHEVKKNDSNIVPRMEIKKNTENILIKSCLNIYIEFYIERFSVKPPQLSDKSAGAEINAIKSMIKYFRTNNKENLRSDVEVLNSFEIVFRNWDRYPVYYQSQLKLRQIWSNLTNIISFIKANHKTMATSKTERIFEYEKNIKAAIDSGNFDQIIANLGKPLHEKN